jgi:5-formyltetrahydrofolate cyclo-ligase
MKKLFLITYYTVLYCDKNGNRIGYGKGFMINFLKPLMLMQKNRRELFPPIDIIDDVSELDVKLDYLITPDEILSFLGCQYLQNKI